MLASRVVSSAPALWKRCPSTFNTVKPLFQGSSFPAARRYVSSHTGTTSSGETTTLTPRHIALGVGAAAGVVGLGMLGSMSAQSPDYAKSTGIASSQLWPAYVRERMKQTFTAFGGGLGITAGTAAAVYRSGIMEGLLLRHPTGATIAFGVGSIGALLSTLMTTKNSPAKYGSYLAFTGLTGLSLVPLCYLGGPIILQAAGYTAGIVGSLSFVAANSPSDKFLWMAGPLSIGLGGLLVANLGSLLFPAARMAPMLQNISLYGGLGLFSLFVLYDTSKVLTNAQSMPEEAFDPVNECLDIYLDTINIFVRMAIILADNKKKNK
eukprot:gb/GECG01000073.1/.p1 GENE.gb/GECG01000073.1/~~gb/GECG01000073.1/.p1  ORF type:complete len:322 (+),score=23.66 gb/GECG01000073.1/:1-966(+)